MTLGDLNLEARVIVKNQVYEVTAKTPGLIRLRNVVTYQTIDYHSSKYVIESQQYWVLQ
jgi:hypothetical protein